MSFVQDIRRQALKDRLVIESLHESGRDIELVLDASVMLFDDDADASSFYSLHLERTWKSLAARGGYRLKLQSVDGPFIVLLFNSLAERSKVSNLDSMLAKRDREDLNRALNKAGLDGNGRFPSPVAGYVKAVDVLAGMGIELDEVVSSHLFRYDSLSITIRLARTNQDDPFSPVSLKNTMLALSWHQLAPNRYEVLAYLS